MCAEMGCGENEAARIKWLAEDASKADLRGEKKIFSAYTVPTFSELENRNFVSC